jgi:CheY-like chemotaxis protein
VREASILLVDDNPDDVVLLREAFAETPRLKLSAVCRSSGEALACLRREGSWASSRRPDLVLLDINLGGRGGFETLGEIRADPKLRSVPTVLLSTSARPEDVARAYSMGASSFVRKPPDFEGLLAFSRAFEAYWCGQALLPDGRE